MDTDPRAFGDNFQSSLRPATQLLNEIVTISKDYQSLLSRNLGINATDMAVIEQVMMTGPQSPSVLARRLALSAAAMTAVVDRLVAFGHVTRSPNPTDRRGVLVNATPASVERALNRVMPVAIAIDGVLDEFDDAQQDVIALYLQRVAVVHRERFPH